MRILQKAITPNGKYEIRVTSKNRYGEYEVQFYSKGKKLNDLTYFTDDEDDAFQTAHKEYNRNT